MNTPTSTKEVELVIKSPGQDHFPGEFYQIFKEDLIPNLLKLLQKIELEEKIPNSLYEANITLMPKPEKNH